VSVFYLPDPGGDRRDVRRERARILLRLEAAGHRRENGMASYMDRIVQRLREAEDDLHQEVEEQQQRWHYQVHRGRVWFDRELQEAHRRLRTGIGSYIVGGGVLTLLTAPVIYSLLLPLALLDLWVTVYQRLCFPIYGIARVPRRAYFAVDRNRLAYLNGIEKVHCVFCTYANGLIAYVREVAARTEEYWCPIKHARVIQAPHARYHLFFDYGDAEGYRRDLPALRRTLRHNPRRGV
jgi:hypothetical protein